jgi:DNA-directed DNA polymerase III PolC
VTGEKRLTADYWTFLARDSLRPLHDLIWKITANNPGPEPCLTHKQAIEAPGLIKIAGERLLTDRLPKPPYDQFYVALSPSTPRGLFRKVQALGLPWIAASDNVYPAATDKEFYRLTIGRKADSQTYPQHILSDEEWRQATEHFAEEHDRALANRAAVAELCQAKMRKARLLVPDKPKSLEQLCIEGAQRKGCDLANRVYAERLSRELALIAEKQFEDYFYILADIVSWAKQRMIVGPARGSSCGSLVCYLLDITAIDPIPYGLIFERFIDVNRMDLPDIDVDFSDAQRHKVFEYVEQRFGLDRVARLGTVSMFQPRSAIKQAGLGLQIPKWRTDKIVDSIISRSAGDARAMHTLEDTLNGTAAGAKLQEEHPAFLIAARMEGHPNNASQHAAGVLITEEPITEYVAVDARTKAAWCDKKDSEELNLLKIDALGLTQLSIFERTLELIGERPVSGWLERIPLDDPAAFEVLNKGQFTGIFQFVGAAMRGLARQVRFERLDDLVAVTALARPGPLGSGGATDWVWRRSGRETPPELHPMLTELTKETYGVVIFQETVMRIVREIGQMSWEDTSAIRKAMSRSLGDEFFDRYWLKFSLGALANGIDEPTAKEIWRQIKTFGSWSFNKSHAVAYGIVSYWCCWLKAHHPVAFAAATLDAEADPAKQLTILRELKNEGIDYVPVDPDHSIDRWVPVKKEDGRTILVGPLTAIKGIGPSKVREVINCRKTGEPIKPGIRKMLESARTPLDVLYPITEAVNRNHPDLTLLNIESLPVPIEKVQCGIKGEVLVIGLVKKVATRNENDPETIKKRKGFRVFGQETALALFLTDDSGGDIFCKIDRHDFERMGQPIIEQAKAGKSLYAIKGMVPQSFRMIAVNRVKYLGEMDDAI